MKYLLLPFLLLFAFKVQAQTIYLSDFNLKEKAVTYIKVFEPADTSNLTERTLSQLKTTSGIVNAEQQGDQIIARIDNMNFDFKKYGGKNSQLPMGMQAPFNGRLIVQFKDGRYRALIQDIEFIPVMEMNVGMFTAKGSNTAIEDIACKAGRKGFRENLGNQRALYYLDQQFSEMLTLKEQETATEDW